MLFTRCIKIFLMVLMSENSNPDRITSSIIPLKKLLSSRPRKNVVELSSDVMLL